ncbi:hypothetical protein Pfo_019278 [Paulownia fortunei]|nr:hypothetical protein Pfo_019278 [Paulownia fortunei]
MESNPVGVRKGVWTPQEDILLRKCIENYGERNWHLVPLRAGLNRCRKSCRLRWLNYLNPNIKRGQFNKDEVDLIIRLHKLLGNRQNFWNSHIDKKLVGSSGETGRGKVHKTITHSNIVRPQPRTFSNFQAPWPTETRETSQSNIVRTTDENPKDKQHPSSAASSSHEADELIMWWSNLLGKETENGLVVDEEHQTRTWPQEMLAGLHDSDNATPQGQGEVDGFSDFSIDVDVWELLSFGDQV